MRNQPNLTKEQRQNIQNSQRFRLQHVQDGHSAHPSQQRIQYREPQPTCYPQYQTNIHYANRPQVYRGANGQNTMIVANGHPNQVDNRIPPIQYDHSPELTKIGKNITAEEVVEPTCCCGCCPITNGGMIVGIVELIITSMIIVSAGIALKYGAIDPHRELITSSREPLLYTWIAFSLFWFLAACLLSYGAKKEKCGFIMPHILINVCFILLSVVQMFFLGVALKYESINQALAISLTILLIIAVLFQSYFLYVTIVCYRWAKKMSQYDRSQRYYIK